MQETHGTIGGTESTHIAEAGWDPQGVWPNLEHALKKLCDQLYETFGTNSADLTMKGFIVFYRGQCAL